MGCIYTICVGMGWDGMHIHGIYEHDDILEHSDCTSMIF